MIYCGAFGFGQRGPYADRPAYDDLIQAATGMAMIQARKGGSPTYVATAMADRVVGMALSNAVSNALYSRERTGHGQSVEVPMFETFAHFVMGDHLYGLTFDPPIGDWGYARMITADRKPYLTLDGYIGVAVYNDKHWRRFFEIAGQPEMASDPRYVDIDARTKHIHELYEYLARTFATKSSDYWVDAMAKADIPAIKLHSPDTLLHDPHMQAVGFFGEQDHPSEGRIRTIGIPQDWSDTKPALRYPAPRLGEHSRSLLSEYGFSQSDIDALIKDGAAIEAAAIS